MRLRLPRRSAFAVATCLLSVAVSAQPARVASDRAPAVLARLTEDARVALGAPGLSAAAIYASARLNSGADTGYGLGWMARQEDGRLRAAHVLTNLDDVPRLREPAEQVLARAPQAGATTRR